MERKIIISVLILSLQFFFVILAPAYCSAEIVKKYISQVEPVVVYEYECIENTRCVPCTYKDENFTVNI